MMTLTLTLLSFSQLLKYSMPSAAAVLRASLERHNDAFESLPRLIPAQYYIANDETEEQAASKYQKHGRKENAPK